MQKKIRGYLEDVAREKGRSIDVCLFGYGTTSSALLYAIRRCGCVRELTVRHSGTLYDCPDGYVRMICGSDAAKDIYEDVIFTSPSVRREGLTIPRGTAITSDTELFFEEKRKNVFCVSGSDGKSTVTTIASLLLSPTFPRLFTGGNLGKPVASAPLDADAFLLELSSFNLRYARPHSKRAILTNVTPNHLDWHASLDEYEECKIRLIAFTDEAILPLSCPFNERLAKSIHTFALVSLHHTDKALRESYDTQHTLTLYDGAILLDGEPILRVDEVGRKEKHNLENLMSAIALTIGYSNKDTIRKVARIFPGLEHRCDTFKLCGKEYVDSSIDTSPERTKTTLESMGRRVHLILGGRGKGLSPDTMKSALIRYAKSISLYGEVRDSICEWLDSDNELSKIPKAKFDTLKDAIDNADGLANVGDTVLLSPSATAYGEFRSFKERGDFFKDYLNKKHGQI